MIPLFRRRTRRELHLPRPAVRPVLEGLEDRTLLSAAATFNFSIPAGVGDPGQTINFFMYGTLESNYTPSSGPNSGQQINSGTVVYLQNTGGVFDWAVPTASADVPAFQTVSADTPDTFSVSLPNTFVKSGDIVMGVGSTTQPFNLLASSGSPVTIPTPVPGSFPNNVYDFAEFTYDASGLDTDLTQVDQVGMPYTITTSNGTVTDQRGITQPLATLQNLFTQYVSATPNASDFKNLHQPGDLRILSPKDYLGSAPSTDPLNSYFNTQILNFFTYYQTHTFTLDYPADGVFTGGTTTITNGGNTYTVLQLSNPNYTGSFDIYEPFFSTNTSGVIPGPPPAPSWLVSAGKSTESPGEMIFSQDGVFNSGGLDPFVPTGGAGAMSDVENAISSGFNRGVATSLAPNDWANAPSNLTASAGNAGSASGDSLVPGTSYYYVITAVNGAGETVVSNEVTATPIGSTPSVTLNWSAANGPVQGDTSPLGVVSYNIYRGTSLGHEVLIKNVSNDDGSVNHNPVHSFIDTGLTPINPAQTPPVYYATGSTSNYYAAFLHQNSTLNPASGISVDGLAYGFPYDDQGGNSTNVQLPTPATATISLVPWIGPSSPLPSPSPSPSPAPTPPQNHLAPAVYFLFLAEDQFALTVDGILSRLSRDPSLAHAADQIVTALNHMFRLDNPALGSGLAELQSAIDANPLHGTLWGYGAEAFGLGWSASVFTNSAGPSA